MSTQVNAIVPLKQKVANVRSLLEKARPQMAMALPRHLTPDKMLRICMTAIQRTPKLLDCTPQSLIGAVMEAAQLGLEPGLLGHCYLVPFKTQCQLIPGYKGLLKLARNSGEISTIQAHAVYEKDAFDFAYGLEARLFHKPTADPDTGKLIAFYAVCKLKDGGSQFEVLWKRQVDLVRARSKASGDGPWVTDYEEMGKKTALRRLCKMLPCSVELAKAVALDERAEAGLPQDIEVIEVAEEAPVEQKAIVEREAGQEG